MARLVDFYEENRKKELKIEKIVYDFLLKIKKNKQIKTQKNQK